MNHELEISWFPSLTDTRPRAVTIELGADPGAFVREVDNSTADKRALPLWSPAKFTGEVRCKSAVQSVHAFVADIDEGAGDYATFSAALAEALPVAWTLHSSFSSSLSAWKWRAIATVSRPIAPNEYASVWPIIASVLAEGGITIDVACKDCSRGYFVPSIPPNGCYQYGAIDGPALNVDLWLGLANEVKPVHATAASPHLSLVHRGDIFERARRYVDSVPGAIQGQHGSDVTFTLANKLVRGFELGDDDALALLSEWNQRCEPPWTWPELERKVRQAREHGTLPYGFMSERGAA